MKVIIKVKNLQLTDSISEYIESKMLGLKKFISVFQKEETGKTLAEVFVEVEKETRHHNKGNIFSAEAQTRLPGKKLIAKAKADDLYKAVNEAKDELEKEIKKYKLKATEVSRRNQRRAKKEINI